MVFKVAKKWHRILIWLCREPKELVAASTELNATETKLEKENLKERKEMMENGTIRTLIRRGDLKFYQRIGERRQEEEKSKNEKSED